MSKSALITPQAILSYPALYEAKPNDNGELFYSCALVFPPGTDLSEMRAAADAAGREKFGAKWNPKTFKLPFREDGEDKGYPAGSVFINAKSKGKPGVVDRYKGPDGKPRPITDPDEMYAGALVRASVRFYGFETKGNKGVAVALNNIQKLGDGERLDGRMKAEDEFDALQADADPLA